MTSRTSMRAAAVAAALTLGAAAAQAQSPIRLGISGGLALPVGTTADFQDPGYNGTVTLAVQPPLVPLGLRVDGMFNRMNGKEIVSGVDNLDLDVSSVNANLTYTLIPLGVASVYAMGGVGYYRYEARDSGADAETDLGYNGGAGIRFGMGGTQLFVEARYHRINNEGDEKIAFVPVTLGFMF